MRVHAFVAAGPVRLERVLIEQHLQQVDDAGPNTITISLLGTQFHTDTRLDCSIVHTDINSKAMEAQQCEVFRKLLSVGTSKSLARKLLQMWHRMFEDQYMCLIIIIQK